MAKLTPEKRIELAILNYVEGKNDFDMAIKEIKLAMSNEFDKAKVDQALVACRRVLHNKPRFKEFIELLKGEGYIA
ncbi:MAG: hypothetical protein ABSB71_08495 [Candidatus Bathyarchaeia archaeon]